MDWITHSVVLLGCLLSVLLSVVEGLTVMRAQESMSITLPCERGGITDFISKSWYRGYFDTNTTAPASSATIYNQIRSGTVGNPGARADMSLDTAAFQLTIARVALEDDSNFTCRVVTLNSGTTFDSVQLNVYIQPEITLIGLDTTTFKENDTAAVRCTIDRVFPVLGTEQFQMKWGTQEVVPSGVQNADGSWRYTVELTHTLTRADNGIEVVCSVDPPRGRPDRTAKTITVQYISGDPAVLTVTPPNPYTDARVTFSCNHGTAIDNPTADTVAWYKDNELLREWPDKSLTHTVTVTTADSGMYTCLVGNVAGYSAMSTAVHLNVSTIVNPVPPASPSVLPAAIGGAVGGVVVIGLVILVCLCCRRSKKNANDDKGSSTAALNHSNHQSLDQVVIPPDDNGDAQYSDIPPARTKPIPAQRSFRKKPEAKPRNPEPIYDIANVNTGTDNKVLYSNVAEANGIEPEYAQVSKPPKKPPRLSTGDNNNADNQQAGLVYADLNLEKARANREQRGIMPPRQPPEPTEYAQIDFLKSGRK